MKKVNIRDKKKIGMVVREDFTISKQVMALTSATNT